ncbi:origin recognition complex subunit 2 [Neoarius graeffei]|uniref:origin recognition complex subunit 2 n=1 Tax=Neoarius graeffei TaxID=443677 RepID=UPI00298C7F6E|nr:origin recognition complex subunit 2 [Neoarius graeffei]XP_060797016.1 origin recognition complex subunit 2 [Neoarius graeffei]
MSPQKRTVEPGALEVQFIGDNDVLDHIVDKHEGSKASQSSVQTLVSLTSPRKPSAGPAEEDADGVLNEQNYIEALGAGTEDGNENGSVTAGASVFTFQTIKRANKMARVASEWARTPGKSVTFSTPSSPEEPPSPARASKKVASQNKTPQKGKKVQFVSTTPHRLRKRISAPNLKSDSDSDFSPSNSEEDEDEEEEGEKSEAQLKTPSKTSIAAAAVLYKTPAKRSKKAPEPSLVEEYFEAHSSSKVLTSDRTLQKLQTPKLDRETLLRLLDGKPSCYRDEITQLNKKHKKNFSKWMLQLQMGFNIVLYGLGSKKLLLEKFRTEMLSDSMHLVVNGFFPSITLKSILNAITGEMLEHDGSFRTPVDQIDFIVKTLKKDPDNHIYLIIHNIDGPMLRGEKNQQALGQLASIPNMHLLASIDHINAPLVWDHAKMCAFNWLWYETTTFLPYTEETSYENSLLVQQTGALALSSLTHVLRSLTPNARGIFRLLAEFQLENKDNPSYTGLSFQDFYQRCREAFLVNSDITLRTQLTEFRDHKLIRTKKGPDGIEYLLIPVDAGTLTDFLEKEDVE